MIDRGQIWLDGEWVDAEQYLKTAEMCGAKTVGEAYGISRPTGNYVVNVNETAPVYVKIIRRNWWQRLWHHFYLWRNRKRIVTVTFDPGDYAYVDADGYIRKAEK